MATADRNALAPHVAMQIAILAEHGAAVSPSTRVLDFGCGDGALVAAWQELGLNIRGCDLSVPAGAPSLSVIGEPYRLPYDDDEFDVVVSDQVFEHVMDYGVAFRELRRVTRPGGVGLHIFPARWRPVEAHVFVPFAGRFTSAWWLRLWASLGVRNRFQKEQDAAAVARINQDWLRTSTNYLTTAMIERAAQPHFRTAWAEDAMLRHAYGRARVLRRVPFRARLLHHLHMRVLITL
ncbi:MAG: hypothetical protein QOI80_1963 [Solirubrobacteraceae bacterium]|jgi:SAM-dependent methyltransferase|nr:hypothetical protein [Solirubrobacteraceae bacterium]